jgi:hypothetical protein
MTTLSVRRVYSAARWDTSKQITEKNVNGSGRGLLQGNIQVGDWRNQEKPRRTSGRIVDVPVEIQNGYLTNTNQTGLLDVLGRDSDILFVHHDLPTSFSGIL